MKVIFIQPYLPEIPSDDAVFPFGYASLDAVLSKHGHEVEILIPEAYHLSLKDIAQKINQTEASLFALGGLFPYLPAVEKLVAMIKELRPAAQIVLGGPMVTYTPELVLRKTGADFCIAGEGEIALLELVNSLENKRDHLKIKGLVFKQGSNMVNNGLAGLMPLEDIPMPNWDKFPLDYYHSSNWYLPTWSRQGPKKVISWLISRGCPMKCNFCASGCQPRYKKIEQVMAELKEINDRFHPAYLMMVDNFLMKNKQYSREFCEGLIKHKFTFKYSMTGRVDIVDEQLLRLFKESGCEIIFYGLECANNEILKRMHKGITVEQTIAAIKKTKEAGISPMVSIMFGQPGETLADFANSLKVALMASEPGRPYPNIASVMPLLTFPGTEIYRYALEKGYLRDEEDYYRQFFSNRIINYTGYSTRTIQTAVDIGNIMYRWTYHHHMSQNFQDNLMNLLARPLRNWTEERRFVKLRQYLNTRPYLKQFLKKMLAQAARLKWRLKITPQILIKDEEREVDNLIMRCLRGRL